MFDLTDRSNQRFDHRRSPFYADLTDKYVNKSLAQLKRQRDKIKAHRTKAESIQLRNEWTQHQNRKNYQLEYDRIVGHINSGRVRGTTADMLKKKTENLKKLGAKAVVSIDDMFS